MRGAAPVRVSRALLSVSDEAGLVDLGAALARFSVELWATSGTRRQLAVGGVSAQPTEELTGIGDWFGGRIKTLHPALLGGILAPRTPEGTRELTERALRPFDLVVVNFYPFARRVAEGRAPDELLESIDVGGVTLARAAAKNHPFVVVVSDPSEYGPLLEELRRTDGEVAPELRRRLAAAAFERCSAYDALIAQRLAAGATGEPFPSSLRLRREPTPLRYGENPHQAAAVYRIEDGPAGAGRPVPVELVKGDRLSYTNLLDLDTAVRTAAEFARPAAVVVKHAIPCGAAEADRLDAAIEAAMATDPVARYGCALAVNRPLDAAAVATLKGIFVDLAVAPSITPEAGELLAKRPKLKVATAPLPSLEEPYFELHGALGRVLVQDGDRRPLRREDLRPATSHRVDEAGLRSLDFAWRVVRHAKSNAVVLASGSTTVGIGAGQTTRVRAVEGALAIAGDRARGAVLASDAFFPFADGVEAAGAAGVAAIVQPGGSLRDPEVLASAERLRIAMYLTGWRVFRH